MVAKFCHPPLKAGEGQGKERARGASAKRKGTAGSTRKKLVKANMSPETGKFIIRIERWERQEKEPVVEVGAEVECLLCGRGGIFDIAGRRDVCGEI